jgi:hypothetical protein
LHETEEQAKEEIQEVFKTLQSEAAVDGEFADEIDHLYYGKIIGSVLENQKGYELERLGNRMEYTILSGWTPQGLIENVNKYIADGWKPCGGAIYADGGEYAGFAQAMIRETK